MGSIESFRHYADRGTSRQCNFGLPSAGTAIEKTAGGTATVANTNLMRAFGQAAMAVPAAASSCWGAMAAVAHSLTQAKSFTHASVTT